MDPDSAKIHCNLGNALLNIDNSEDAFDHYYKALQCNPDKELKNTIDQIKKDGTKVTLSLDHHLIDMIEQRLKAGEAYHDVWVFYEGLNYGQPHYIHIAIINSVLYRINIFFCPE